VGIVSGPVPKIEVQIGTLRVNALLDSGSVRSLILQEQFQGMRNANPKIQILNTEVNCVMALGQSLEIHGEAKVPLKVRGFSWLWTFLVSRKLKVNLF
jgi:hypothetical protein